MRANQAAALLIGAVGVVYATRSKVMPYHLDVLGMPWEALPSGQQLLLRVLLNGAGALAVAVAVALFLLLRDSVRRERWAIIGFFVVGMLASAPTTLIVLVVRARSAAEPPLAVPLVGNVLLVIGLVAGLWGRAREGRS